MREILSPSQDVNQFLEFRVPGSRPGTFGRLILIFSLPGRVVACRGESRPVRGLVPGVRLAERAVVILGLARSSSLDGMYVLDVALAPRTRSSPVPDKVWGVNREELQEREQHSTCLVPMRPLRISMQQ